MHLPGRFVPLPSQPHHHMCVALTYIAEYMVVTLKIICLIQSNHYTKFGLPQDKYHRALHRSSGLREIRAKQK
jgi:hypothetical protein